MAKTAAAPAGKGKKEVQKAVKAETKKKASDGIFAVVRVVQTTRKQSNISSRK